MIILEETIKMKLNLKELIKDNTVYFQYYRKGHLYYAIGFEGESYSFPVPIEDTGDASFNVTEKAILLMRYIRKAMDEGSFAKYQAH